jgi:hypothetical protein
VKYRVQRSDVHRQERKPSSGQADTEILVSMGAGRTLESRKSFIFREAAKDVCLDSEKRGKIGDKCRWCETER